MSEATHLTPGGGRERCRQDGCSVFVPKNADYCRLHTGRHPDAPAETEGQEAAPEGHGPEFEVDQHLRAEGRIGLGDEERATLSGAVAGTRSRSRHKPPEHVEAEFVGARYAQLLYAHEQEERLKRSRGRQPLRDELGYRVPEALPPLPFRVLPRRVRPDPTRIIDPTTKETPKSLKPGWCYRWVSTEDWAGRPYEERTSQMEDYGYEYVLDAEGNAITGRYGVAMQGPPEQYAARVIDCQPEGALDRDKALSMAHELSEAANSYAGDAVTSVIVGQDHARRRYTRPLGTDPDDE